MDENKFPGGGDLPGGADEKGVQMVHTPDEGLSNGPTPPVSQTDAANDEGADTSRTPDTFPREYVEKLRKESAGYRERARQVDEVEKRADGLARRLHAALVAADGRLADPTDLPFDPAHLDSEDSLKSAIADLVTAKPHLKARRVTGDIGAGARGSMGGPKADLIEIMRGF